MGEKQTFSSVHPNQVGVPILVGGLNGDQVSGASAQ